MYTANLAWCYRLWRDYKQSCLSFHLRAFILYLLCCTQTKTVLPIHVCSGYFIWPSCFADVIYMLQSHDTGSVALLLSFCNCSREIRIMWFWLNMHGYIYIIELQQFWYLWQTRSITKLSIFVRTAILYETPSAHTFR